MRGDRVPTPLGAVLKVHYAIEYLKVHDALPEIVVMPDLRPEFEVEDLDQIQPDGHGLDARVPTRPFGGHAGHAALTLGMLRYIGEAGFGLHCVLKVDEAARSSFDTYLVQGLKQRGCQPVDNRYLVPGGVSLRMIYVQKAREQPRRRALGVANMTVQDLVTHLPSPIPVIQRADIVAVLCPAAGILPELLEPTNAQFYRLTDRLFLDTATYVHEALTREVLDRLRSAAPHALLVSMSEREATEFHHLAYGRTEPIGDRLGGAWNAAVRLSAQEGLPLFFHCEELAAMIRPGKETVIAPCFALSNKNPRANGAGDTLNAALMLALAVRRRLDNIAGTPQELSISEEECVLYAISVVSARLEHNDWQDRKGVESFAGSATLRTTTSASIGERHLRRIAEMAGAYEAQKKELVHPESCTELVRMLGTTGTTRFWALQNANLVRGGDQVLHGMIASQDAWLAAAAAAELRAQRRAAGPEVARITMVDLDNTLLQSAEARRNGGMWALRQLDLQGRELDDAISLYCGPVYQDYSRYEGLFKADFRIVWNHPDSYWVLLGLLELGVDSGNYQERSQEKFFNRELMTTIRQLRKHNQNRQNVRKACNAFWDAPMDLFPDALEFLHTLRYVCGVHLFILSEGDPDCQARKLEKLGLTLLLPAQEDRMFVTGTAASVSPIENMVSTALRALERLEQRLREQAAKGMGEAEQTSENIAREREVLGWVGHNLSKYLFARGQPRRWDALVKARQTAIRALPTAQSARIAVVGDRWKVNVQPIRELTDEVHTVLVRRGQYAGEDIDAQPAAHKTVHTLTEASSHLASPSTWDAIPDLVRSAPKHIARPDVPREMVEQIGKIRVSSEVEDVRKVMREALRVLRGATRR